MRRRKYRCIYRVIKKRVINKECVVCEILIDAQSVVYTFYGRVLLGKYVNKIKQSFRFSTHMGNLPHLECLECLEPKLVLNGENVCFKWRK